MPANPPFIQPLTIGSLQFTHNLIQGPLAGYSCAPFRKLFSQFMPPAYCVTEMISAKELITTRKQQKTRFLWRDPVEHYLCYQLSGNCPKILQTAALMVTDLGADIIDLNCGCPKPKIRSKQAGSFLLNNAFLIAEIVTAMKKITSVPITVKIRVDGNSHDANNIPVAKAIADAGADALIVHGRHWTEDYQTSCHFTQIAQIVDAVTIPVIGNGDVHDLKSLQHMFSTTHCAGVMISRAGTGKPWLFAQLYAQWQGQNYSPPTPTEINELFKQHITGLATLENTTKAELESRKLWHYYFGQSYQPSSLLG